MRKPTSDGHRGYSPSFLVFKAVVRAVSKGGGEAVTKGGDGGDTNYGRRKRHVTKVAISVDSQLNLFWTNYESWPGSIRKEPPFRSGRGSYRSTSVFPITSSNEK